MNTLQNADTFFYITSIVTILVGVLVIIVLAYVVRIAQIIHGIAKTVRRESENVAEDLADLRGRVREEGMKVSSFWKFATGFILNRFAGPAAEDISSRRTRSRRSAKKTTREDSDDEPESEE